MNTLIFAFLLLLTNLSAAAFIYYKVWPLQRSTHRTMLLVVALSGAILFDLLFVLAHQIPRHADTFLAVGIERIESNVDNISPGYAYEPLDTAQIRTLLSDTKQIESYLRTNDGTRLAVRLIGVKAYIGYLHSFISSLDTNLTKMQAEGTPVTLHNVLARVRTNSRAATRKAAFVFEILLLVAVLALAAFLLFSYFAHKRGWTAEASVTLGEDEETR